MQRTRLERNIFVTLDKTELAPIKRMKPLKLGKLPTIAIGLSRWGQNYSEQLATVEAIC